MSRLKDTLRSDLTDAIRGRDAVRAGTLRMVLTSVTTEEVAGTEARELSDDDVLKVIAKEAKKRREASTAYTGAGRPELAAKEDAELADHRDLPAGAAGRRGDRGARRRGGRRDRCDGYAADGPGHEGGPAARGRTRRWRPGGRRRPEGARRLAVVR